MSLSVLAMRATKQKLPQLLSRTIHFFAMTPNTWLRTFCATQTFMLLATLKLTHVLRISALESQFMADKASIYTGACRDHIDLGAQHLHKVLAEPLQVLQSLLRKSQHRRHFHPCLRGRSLFVPGRWRKKTTPYLRWLLGLWRVIIAK
jgi:hypothetical protein